MIFREMPSKERQAQGESGNPSAQSSEPTGLFVLRHMNRSNVLTFESIAS